MRAILVVLALTAGCASTSGTEGGGKPAAAAATAETAAADGDQICRKMTVAGSIRTQRICATAEEWAERDREGIEGADDFRRARSAAGGALPTEGSP